MDEKDMKIEALKQQFSQRVAALTTEYEENIADLRIAVTKQQQELDQLKAAADAADQEPVEGAVVDE